MRRDLPMDSEFITTRTANDDDVSIITCSYPASIPFEKRLQGAVNALDGLIGYIK